MAGAEEVADRAYLRLGHRSESQAIVFLYVTAGSHVKTRPKRAVSD
jgi:hypothetical protein